MLLERERKEPFASYLPESSSAQLIWDSNNMRFVGVSDATGEFGLECRSLVPLDAVLKSIFDVTTLGTGGHQCWKTQRLPPASGAYIVVEDVSLRSDFGLPSTALTASVALDVGKELSLLRHYLSLTMTELSRILLVERPTAYAWLDEKWEPKPENKARIRKLSQVVHTWLSISNHPIGAIVREPLQGESSVMDVMTNSSLDIAAITRKLHIAGAALRQTKNRTRVPSVREIAKGQGFKPVETSEEDERFDSATRF